MRVNRSARARGGNRGGCGGGYEQTDPDWALKRLRRLRAEYDALEPYWKEVFLGGLNKADQYAVLNRDP